MSQLRVWRKRLAAALEWSAVDKGLILIAQVTPLFLQYLAWSCYVLSRPDRERLVNVDFVKQSMVFEASLLAIGLLIALAGLALRRKRPELLLFQHVAIQFFAISLVLIGYTIGSLSFPTGIVLLGAPIFGFILLDRLAVWLATIAALTLLLGLSYASAYGLIPYAPTQVVPTDAASNLFWMNSQLFFAAPFLILITFMADQMLNWWREREDKIRELSRTDALTGLHNRRRVFELLSQEIARAERYDKPLSVVILDLDHFKKINDTYGHPSGDLVLKAVAQVLSAQVREVDHVGRYGGEEFIIVLPSTTLVDALTVVERCRQQLCRHEIISDNGSLLHISASFGLICLERVTGNVLQQLIQGADHALYQAKALGRNRIEVFA